MNNSLTEKTLISNISNTESHNIDTSVIIVNYNSGKYLEKTIESLYENTKNINFEVILLDNNSNKNDESFIFIENRLENYKNLKLLKNNCNLGFAKANNVGLKISQGKNILLLNPDVLLKTNTVKILSDYLNANNNVGMVGPKVCNTNGSFQSSCRRGAPYPSDVLLSLTGISNIFKNNPNFNKFSLNHLNINEINEVVGLSGCCLMVKKELINQIGLMDEQFFLYQEETDWCWRAYKANWKIIYNPEAEIVHEKEVSTKKNLPKNNIIFCNSMYKFIKKHYFPEYNLIQKLLFTTLIWFNFPLRLLRFIISR